MTLATYPKHAKIIAYLRAGHTHREAAAHFDISAAAIGRIVRRNGVSWPRGRRKGKTTEKGAATKSAVLHAIDAGCTWNEIARVLGMTKQNVSRIAIANGRRRKQNGRFVNRAERISP